MRSRSFTPKGSALPCFTSKLLWCLRTRTPNTNEQFHSPKKARVGKPNGLHSKIIKKLLGRVIEHVTWRWKTTTEVEEQRQEQRGKGGQPLTRNRHENAKKETCYFVYKLKINSWKKKEWTLNEDCFIVLLYTHLCYQCMYITYRVFVNGAQTWSNDSLDSPWVPLQQRQRAPGLFFQNPFFFSVLLRVSNSSMTWLLKAEDYSDINLLLDRVL